MKIGKALLFHVFLLLAQTQVQAQTPSLPRIAGHIGGDANGLAEEGGLIYWIMGPSLQTGRFNVTTERMEILGKSAVLPETPQDIAVNGGFAYVTDGSGLKILDARDASRPRLAGSLDLTGSVLDVTARDGYVYIASALLGLRVVNASNPAAPALVTEIPMISGATGVLVDGDRLIAVDGSFGLRFYDLADPANPRDIGQFVQDGLSGVLHVDGSLVYAGFTNPPNGAEGFLIIDASDPANAAQLSFYNAGGLPTGIDVSGGYAHFMTEGFPELEVVDVTDPANPRIPVFGGARLRLRGDPGDVAVIGSLAYVSTGTWGIRVVDLRSLVELEEVAEYSPAGLAFDVDVRGNFAYLATFQGLRIIDVREPSTPVYAGRAELDGLGVGVAVNGTDLYLGTQDGLVRLFDVTDPIEPVLRSDVDIGGWPLDFEPRGNLLYATTYFGQSLQLMERRTAPTNIVPTIQYARAFLPFSVALSETRAYILTARFGNAPAEIHIMDITDPGTMTFVSSIDLPGSHYGIEVSGAHAYVAGDQGLLVIDLSDERNPAIGRNVSTPSALQSLVLDGGFAYAVTQSDGLRVYDLTDPAQPVETAALDLPGELSRVHVSGIHAFVTSVNGGLYVVQIHPKVESAEEEGNVGEDSNGTDGIGGGFGGNGAKGPAHAGGDGGGGCGCQVSASDEDLSSAPFGALFILIVLPAIFFITLREHKRKKPE